MIVHKFGGTSIGSTDRFARVADIILDHHGQGDGAGAPGGAVVVSAMSGVTDQLIAGARAASEGRDTAYRKIKADLLSRHLDVVETLLDKRRERLKVGGLIEDQLHDLELLYRSIAVLGELTARGRDAVSSFGEQISVHILAAVLRERDARARALSSTELIVTNAHFGAASPLMDPTRRRLQQRVRPLIEQGVLPVITGYIGATEDGLTTTLGRGGSDFSAAVIGTGLDADEVWIWSDVDGILTADPNIVPQARTLTELSYSEAAELAYVGAEVLHPKTIRPVIQRKIPLRIVNSFNPAHAGTLIVESPNTDRQVLPAIICLRILGREFTNGREDDPVRLGVEEKVSTVSVVGPPGWNRKRNGIAAQAFSALGECETRVIAVAQAATERSVSFCIPEDQLAGTVRFLHRKLGLEDGPRTSPPRSLCTTG